MLALDLLFVQQALDNGAGGGMAGIDLRPLHLPL
jgi:hypothetical protein